tara:strand:+ start:1805 stop:2233 length:429 start_codon:yes stop_codon:yes gene_type:complete
VKIIKDRNSNVVSDIFSDDTVIILNEEHLKVGTFTNTLVNFTTHEIVEAEYPDTWVPYALKYEDGSWVTHSSSLLEEAENTLLENLSARARVHRDSLLAATDWTAMSDAPTQATAMTTYRQSLRDITSQSEWPTTIIWPTAP